MTAVSDMAWSFGALMILSTLTIGLRIFVKHRRGRPIRKDDYTLAAAWVFLLTSLIFIMVAASQGYGQHLADLKSDPTEAVKLVGAAEFFAVSAGAIAKTSVAMTLLKVLKLRWQRSVTWWLAASVNIVIWGFAIFLWVIISQGRLVSICKEAGAVWRFAMFGAVWSALTDFAFSILPWPFVWKLHQQKAEKILLGLGMSCGIGSGVIAIVKITQMDCRNFEHDITHDSVALVIWTFAEPVAIIVAASVPILRKLFEKPAQAALERELMGARGGRGIPPSNSFPPTAGLGRQTNTWNVTSGPFDSSIALQTLGARDSILRTDALDIRIEEINPNAPQRAPDATQISKSESL
ncbi:hypothetical protein C8A01DRAFT_37732 [Parachaetomium inaequale]|uniref:Rhodopsin domain-containing protein n=1 Tax=Parachaetomium inaequale TaxID=2588326 RepID=A0AAN6SQA9_9PEZI|nr:hypothetical protein C8A01DRAFT_37732 [Parachaetomium inaequale]